MWVSIKDVRNGLGLKNITKKKKKTPDMNGCDCILF